MTRVLLQAMHVWAWALVYGAITYTYYRLHQQMRELTHTDEEYEVFVNETAPGLHRWTFAALTRAGATGAGLAWSALPLPTDAGWWRGLVAVKTGLLLVMIAVQAYVSRVMWPRRTRAPRTEWPAERRRFFNAALVLGFLSLVQLVLGALTHVARVHAAR